MFSVCLCARFQANPKESHLSAVNKILRYLKHTPSIGLWYLKGASLDLLGYSDSDFARSHVDRKSTSGGCHLLGRSLVSWSSKKQNSVALSTAEAEYIAAGACLKRPLIRENLNVIQNTSPRSLMPHLLHQMVHNRTNLGGHSIQIMIKSNQATT